MSAQAAIAGIMQSIQQGQTVGLEVFEGFLQSLSAGSPNDTAVFYAGEWLQDRRYAWEVAETLTQQSDAATLLNQTEIGKYIFPEGQDEFLDAWRNAFLDSE